MSKKDIFVKFINENVDFSKAPEDVQNYWNIYTATKEKEPFTENGKIILKFLKENVETLPMAKAKNISEGLGIPSRSISGTMKKLVTDGYVDKIGENPCIYTLTNLGKEINLD